MLKDNFYKSWDCTVAWDGSHFGSPRLKTTKTKVEINQEFENGPHPCFCQLFLFGAKYMIIGWTQGLGKWPKSMDQLLNLLVLTLFIWAMLAWASWRTQGSEKFITLLRKKYWTKFHLCFGEDEEEEKEILSNAYHAKCSFNLYRLINIEQY